MASIVLIESNGTVKTLKTKELTIDSLYKKCGFRVNEDFLCRHTWKVKVAASASSTSKEEHIISVWAKQTGKANSENKYDFPPPIDKNLFFGTCAVVRTSPTDKNTFMDLTSETWLKIYEKLFGGFEDIGDEDEYSEDELANVDPALLTKNGYLKDGFVVSDKELTSKEGTPTDGDEEDEPAIVPEKKVKRVVKKGRPQAFGLEPEEEVVVKTTEVKAKAKPKQDKKTEATGKKTEAKGKKTEAKATEVKAAEVKGKKNKPAEVKAQSDAESESDPEDTTSELEEEVYTFSDDD